MFTPKADPVRRTLFAERNVRRLLIFAVFLGACAPAAGEAIPDTPVATAPVATATERAPTHTVMPSPTTPPSETATATSIPTSLPEPTVTMPFEFIPVLSVGATGDFSVIDGSLDVLGVVEVTGEREIVIRDFSYAATGAPGVDIRLGLDDDFGYGASVVLMEITDLEFDGETLTLTIPDEASGREFNSIAVWCFTRSVLFDYALLTGP